MSAQVIDIGASRKVRDAATSTPTHPSLRWIAGGAYWVAHRRDVDGRPACGAPGELVLASNSVPLCTDCVPAAQAVGVVL